MRTWIGLLIALATLLAAPAAHANPRSASRAAPTLLDGDSVATQLHRLRRLPRLRTDGPAVAAFGKGNRIAGVSLLAGGIGLTAGATVLLVSVAVDEFGWEGTAVGGAFWALGLGMGIALAAIGVTLLTVGILLVAANPPQDDWARRPREGKRERLRRQWGWRWGEPAVALAGPR
jgi:hypothetical protein